MGPFFSIYFILGLKHDATASFLALIYRFLNEDSSKMHYGQEKNTEKVNLVAKNKQCQLYGNREKLCWHGLPIFGTKRGNTTDQFDHLNQQHKVLYNKHEAVQS